MRAVFNEVTIAESDQTRVVEGNHYFPPDSVRWEYLTPSRMRSLGPWKGIASYRSVLVDGVEDRNAAGTYRHPSPLARRIKGYVAFWHGVHVRDCEPGSPLASRVDWVTRR
jgi:uncharacterized protein (DUF427 family)